MKEIQLPHDLIIERRVLGAILDPEVYVNVMDELDIDQFYSSENKSVMRAIQEVASTQDVNVDIVNRKLKDIVDSPIKLTSDLLIEAALPSFTPSLVKELQKLKARREAALQAHVLYERAVIEDDDIYDVINETQMKLNDIQESKSNSPILIGDVLEEAHEQILARQEAGVLDGIMSGFNSLDEILHGFQPGELIIIGARPGMGKSALLMQIIYNISKRSIPTLTFTLEMSQEQIAKRLISTIGEIRHDIITKSWNLQKSDNVRIRNIIDTNQDLPLYLLESPGITGERFYSKSRRLQMQERKLGLIAIDHATRMAGGKKGQSNYEKFTEISRKLKDTALDIGLPVIALIQLNRGCEMRNDKRPQLSDLRDTGAWEEDADKILFIYRDEYYNKETEARNEAEIIIAKNRSGSSGTVKMLFRDDCVRFYEKGEVICQGQRR